MREERSAQTHVANEPAAATLACCWPMGFTMINKLEAAQQQLDCAITLLLSKQDSLAVHTLAYAAYRLLYDHHGASVQTLLDELERSLEFRAIPNFLKHADRDSDAILKDHSLETTALTIALATRLWKELGRQETPAMIEFSKLPNPYKPGYRHGEAFEFVRSGPIPNPQAAQMHLARIVTRNSTSEAPIIPDDDT